jgi:hypothetical protein
VLVAAVTHRLVLHSAAALIEFGVGELHDVERIGDLGGVRNHGVEHAAIGPGQIQRRPGDPGEPFGAALGEPAARLDAAASRDHVEERAGADIDDRR